MKILLDLQSCQTNSSRLRGIGRYSMSLARHMIKEGRQHEFWVLLNNAWPEACVEIRAAFSDILPNHRIVEFSGRANSAFSEVQDTRALKASQAVREHLIRQINPDVIHIASLFEGFADNAVISFDDSRLAQRTCITLYDLIPLVQKDHYLQNTRYKQWYYQGLAGLHRAGCLLAISESSRQEALDLLGIPVERVETISTAIDTQFTPCPLDEAESMVFRNRYALGDKYVMYTGGADYRKNLEGLIDAWALLPKAIIENHRLAIVCNIDDENHYRLQKRIKSAGLVPDSVCFTGYVPETDLVLLYSNCELFIFPSLHEGFGLPALEAMACGAPVIASDCSSLPEVIGMEEALFTPQDPQSIADKIYQALTDKLFRQRLILNSTERPALFNWPSVARRALDVIESKFKPGILDNTQPSSLRPHLAWVAPVPPARSGVAVYAHHMLVALLRDYRITVVTPEEAIDSAWIDANCDVISPAEFMGKHQQFDRVVYHMGNSEFHTFMLPLLEQCPGVIVMHDCFLSGMLNYMEERTGKPLFSEALFRSHGFAGLYHEQRDGRGEAIRDYPCSGPVLNSARRVIVHSQHAQSLIEPLCRQGITGLVPLIAPALSLPSRDEARAALGFASDTPVIVSFGFVMPGKCSDLLLEAFSQSSVLRRKKAMLCFVGSDQGGYFGQQLREKIAKAGLDDLVQLTGFVSPDQYYQYLAAADVAVQLRTDSRGETSAAILECLGAGLPLIVNRHGSAAELPDESCLKLPEKPESSVIAAAMEKLLEPEAAKTLRINGPKWIARAHAPSVAAEGYVREIEAAWNDHAQCSYDQLLQQLGELKRSPAGEMVDWLAVARDIADQQPVMPGQQLIDISHFKAQSEMLAPLQHQALKAFLLDDTHSTNRALVYQQEGEWWYGHDFTAQLLELAWIPVRDHRVDGMDKMQLLSVDDCCRLMAVSDNKVSQHSAPAEIEEAL